MAHNEARDGDEVTGTYRYESVSFAEIYPVCSTYELTKKLM